MSKLAFEHAITFLCYQFGIFRYISKPNRKYRNRISSVPIFGRNRSVPIFQGTEFVWEPKYQTDRFGNTERPGWDAKISRMWVIRFNQITGNHFLNLPPIILVLFHRLMKWRWVFLHCFKLLSLLLDSLVVFSLCPFFGNQKFLTRAYLILPRTKWPCVSFTWLLSMLSLWFSKEQVYCYILAAP